jgi:hypothetical protein
MALIHSPHIVTSGLVLILDAGNPKSYPGSGTTWKDLSGNGHDGTLVNGTGFDSANFGSLTFDGTNDAIENANFASAMAGNLVGTVNIWFKIPSSAYSTNASDIILNVHQPPHNPFTIGFNVTSDVAAQSKPKAAIRISDDDGGTSHQTLKARHDTSNPSKYYDDTYHYVSMVCGSNFNKLYMDGEELSLTYEVGNSSTGNFLFRTSTNIFDISGTRTSSTRSRHFIGNVPSVFVYNRPLTELEIKQNFIALKGRFGR